MKLFLGFRNLREKLAFLIALRQLLIRDDLSLGTRFKTINFSSFESYSKQIGCVVEVLMKGFVRFLGMISPSDINIPIKSRIIKLEVLRASLRVSLRDFLSVRERFLF